MRTRDIIRVEDISPRRVTVSRASAIAALYGKTWADVVGRSRKPQHIIARAAVCADLRRQGWSLLRIGKLIGRDHKTVLNALRKWEAVYSGDSADSGVDTLRAVTQRGRAGGALAAPHPALNTGLKGPSRMPKAPLQRAVRPAQPLSDERLCQPVAFGELARAIVERLLEQRG